jgi:hypothetical protein
VSLELHHIWPTGYRGPNVKKNKILICTNAHSAVHRLMDQMLKAQSPYVLPWSNLRRYGLKVRFLAVTGYYCTLDQKLPPWPLP